MLRGILVTGALAWLAGCGPPEQAAEETVAEQPTEANRAPAEQAMTVSAPDGVTIHYDAQGQGQPAIVFVHGWSCDRSYWDAQRDYFAKKHRVVTVDLAGHGESSAERDDYTMSAFGADVAAVVQALDLTNVVLVGHSMGGPVVVEAAKQLKGRVAAVVGADTFKGVGQRPSPAELEDRMARLDVDFVGDVQAIVESMFVADSDPQLRSWVVDDMSSAPPRVAKSAMRGLSSYQAAAAIAALDVPFVLINSDYRPADPAAIKALAKSFEYIEMSGVGHFVMMEDPQTFNSHLQAIIQSLPSHNANKEPS